MTSHSPSDSPLAFEHQNELADEERRRAPAAAQFCPRCTPYVARGAVNTFQGPSASGAPCAVRPYLECARETHPSPPARENASRSRDNSTPARYSHDTPRNTGKASPSNRTLSPNTRTLAPKTSRLAPFTENTSRTIGALSG